VKEAKGWIDTCPFWDDDGKAYLVHAFANSRAGVANVLDICRMSPDGTRLLDDNPAIPGNGAAIGTRIYDGGQSTINPPRPPAAAFASAPRYTTVEGPKFYKRNGYYYVMAPGGGVAQGYQIVFRAKNVLGPYESRIVLDKGSTNVNGPHQGGWVETPTIDGKREDWFIHFQEVLPYGRILHLQPVKWENDWPVMGDAAAGAEKGQPVLTHAMPLSKLKIENPKSKLLGVPQTSDEFDLPKLGLQWQWWANFKPEWASLTARPGSLRLAPVSLDKATLNYNRPNLLLQKFPAESFTVTTRLDVSALAEGETAGLILAGKTMSSLTCSKTPAGIKISRTNYNANNARGTDAEETAVTLTPKEQGVVHLRMKVAPRGICTFQVSSDGITFTDLGTPVTAINATWIGAKVGIFCNAPANAGVKGHADFDYFHVEK
jgi:beta-xylosidase